MPVGKIKPRVIVVPSTPEQHLAWIHQKERQGIADCPVEACNCAGSPAPATAAAGSVRVARRHCVRDKTCISAGALPLESIYVAANLVDQLIDPCKTCVTAGALSLATTAFAAN